MELPDVTLAEELLLLALDPARGRTRCDARDLSYGLAAAALADLELSGRIVEHRGRISVTDPRPPADPLLAKVLVSLVSQDGGRASRGVRVQAWVRGAAPYVEEMCARRLAERGAVRVEMRRVLRLFSTRRLPAGPLDWSTPSRDRLDAAVRSGYPDRRSRLLGAFASATGLSDALYTGLDSRRIRREMRQLAREEWPAYAVRCALEKQEAAAPRSPLALLGQ
ncbi:GOLPH3/VPS74 family protein [Streptomyces sp. TP-A0874]|uniref:GOLPH3/VPS74 family protein n=1 Tax=Streptomyces sp. TP-A0874 TaxID=549819 RepID=UPI000853B227|nr:GPP34 family phosphoprotein [Streptomyces sp. TP-A0874]